MQNLRKFQKAVATSVLGHIGINPYWEKTFSSGIRQGGNEMEVHHLPTQVSAPIQNPTTGQDYFMAGISRAGGPDPLGDWD